MVDGVSHRGVDGNRHQARGHDASPRILGVFHQFAHDLRLAMGHERQDSFAVLLGQVGEYVGGIVRCHLLDDAGQGTIVELCGDAYQRGCIEFGQDPGREGLCQQPEAVLAVPVIEAAQQVRQVDGVLAVEHQTQRRHIPGGERIARRRQQDISSLLQAAVGQRVVRGLIRGSGHGNNPWPEGRHGGGRSNIGPVAGPMSTL